MNFVSAWLRHMLPTFLLLIAVFIIGYWAGYKDRPVIIDTAVRVINPLSSQDYLLPPLQFRPVTRVVFSDPAPGDTVTVIKEVRVPVGYDRVRLLPDNYIQFVKGSVYLRYYDGGNNRFELDRISIPEPVWTANKWAQASYYPLAESGAFTLGAEVRRKQLSIIGEFGMALPSADPIIKARLRYYF